MYRCDDLAIVDELAASARRGINVQILMTQLAPRGWDERLKDLANLLRNLGTDVRLYESSVMKYHDKYVVVDDAFALVTSANLIRKSFETTCDYLLFTESPHIVEGLKKLFENDFSTRALPFPHITDRFIVGPEGARQRLTEIIASARKSIDIIDRRLTDPQILELLKARADDGVSVRIVGEQRTDGLTTHGRMILIDGQIAVLASMHLAAASLDSRRELAIVLEDAPVVQELNAYFESLSAAGFSINSMRFPTGS